MEITEVRVKLISDTDDRLQAFCSITFDDCFVVRDLKIIEGTNGYFVAMPSRKLTSLCHSCRSKNHLRAAYCNQCGARLREDPQTRDADGRIKLYADVAHPVNSACRDQIQSRVIATFKQELERSKHPGYVSNYDDEYGDPQTIAAELEEPRSPSAPRREPPHAEPPGPHRPRNEPSHPRSTEEGFGAGIF